MRVRTAFASLMLALAVPAVGAPSAAVEDATKWLALIDTGNYAGSWTAAGTIFRSHLKQDAWVGTVGATRKPFGAVLSRTVLKEQPAKSLPGVPDGDYDVIQFATTFANKKDAIETVVLARETDGWRADGYFIK